MVRIPRQRQEVVKVQPKVPVKVTSVGKVDGVAPLDALEAGRTAALATLERNLHKVSYPNVPEPAYTLDAGKNHFAALWARDTSFAALGLLAEGKLEPVRDYLVALLENSAPEGWVPRRIGPGANFWQALQGFLGIHPKRSDNYPFVDFNKGLGKAPVDPNSLVVWLAAEYVFRSHDTEFLAKYLPKLQSAVAWLDRRAPSGLLEQGPYEDWRDLTGRSGKTLYGNVLYWKAKSSLAALEERAGQLDEARRHKAAAGALGARIRDAFWVGEPGKAGYFRDQLGLDQFGGDSNFLAAAAGLATPEEARSIIDVADQRLMRDGGLYATIDPPFPDEVVPWYLGLASIRGYGDGTLVWPWVTSLYAQAAVAAGDTARAEKALAAVAGAAARDGTFAEIYDGQGGNAGRGLYKSEVDFSWSAGLYLAGLHRLREVSSPTA